MGCTFGWVLELFYRRLAHGYWVNPGFLVGPYLPIYGFGLCALTVIYLTFYEMNLPSILVIILMGAAMTLIEFIGGLSFVNKPVKLWDYSNNWGNYKGIICPLFSLIWTFISALYYFFLSEFILDKVIWFNNHIIFSFVLGMFMATIIIDYAYSTKLLSKVRKYAKEREQQLDMKNLKRQLKNINKKSKKRKIFIHFSHLNHQWT
ncbi:MAG: putative ABC transporter permease [Clostridium sp.]|nr:MAG: putative ABC transporter permease [Clostridium sp.]